jgi:hypothetical protein
MFLNIFTFLNMLFYIKGAYVPGIKNEFQWVGYKPFISIKSSSLNRGKEDSTSSKSAKFQQIARQEMDWIYSLSAIPSIH